MSDTDSFAMDFDSSKQWAFNLGANPIINPALLRVYLATPLTITDPETDRDRLMVREVTKDVLRDYDYLGVRLEIYDPGEVTPPGSDHSIEEVYVTDHNRTANADLVLFHVNSPSLGVGMEAQIAAEATVPRVVISKVGAPVSRMFLGVFSPTIATIHYTTSSDFRAELSRALPEITRATLESAKVRREILEELRCMQLGRRILKQRILRGISLGQLARSVDMREFFLRRLERDAGLAANITHIQLRRIVSTIGCKASITSSGVPSLVISDTELHEHQRQSLENLIDFIVSKPEWLPDERIFRVWSDYLEGQREEEAEAVRHRSASTDSVLTVEDWERRYSSLGLF